MNKFTKRAESTIEFARLIASELGHTYIGSEHLLLALLSECDGEEETRAVFEHFNIFYPDILHRVVTLFGKGEVTTLTARDMTSGLLKIIDCAASLAKKHSGSRLDNVHLATALLLDSQSVASRIIEYAGAKRIKVLNLFLSSLENDKKITLQDDDDKDSYRALIEASQRQTPVLNKFGRDLVLDALKGKFDNFVGREKESDRVIRILMRKNKNNPCLIGEAGVGKTAIAEEIATRIANRNVPSELLGNRIVSLDISSVVAGAKYRGDFEERIRTMVEEVAKAGNVILFIDEIHNIVGAGSAEGAVDAANILKPSLARGEIRVIGATTLREYKKYIEKDSALERRFQPVVVQEPNVSEALEILKGIRENYESFHGVKITDRALLSCIELSKRYITDRFLPDKAIDLMDESASRKKISGDKIVDSSDIEAIVEEWLGIPQGQLGVDEREKIHTLSHTLKENIIGQDSAIDTLCSAYMRARLGLADESRPTGVYLFAGPAGVGKTELAKLFANEVFGKNSLITLDMSEYSEAHTVSKLIGAPPGYVGFEDSVGAFEKLRHNPYSMVVFDEIEKAHHDVLNLLLQILEAGKITNSKGEEINFRNTVVVLTSNVGNNISVGFEKNSYDGALGAIRKTLSPELYSRLDEVILFSRLDETCLEKIAEKYLSEFAKRIEARGRALCWMPSVINHIVKSSDKTIGARGVRNYIKKEVENKVSELIVDCAEDENKIELDVKDGRIDISLQNVKIEQAKA